MGYLNVALIKNVLSFSAVNYEKPLPVFDYELVTSQTYIIWGKTLPVLG